MSTPPTTRPRLASTIVGRGPGAEAPSPRCRSHWVSSPARTCARTTLRDSPYTTAPLEAPLEVTGHPVVHLWLTSSADDGDFFVYLEDIEPDGRSAYVSEGQLRASHRRLSEAPYDRMGLPYHRSYAEDAMALVPGELAELVFDLQPTSVIFRQGHRIRVTITCAAKDTFTTPVLDPAPVVNLLRDAAHPSRIVLPVIVSMEE